MSDDGIDAMAADVSRFKWGLRSVYGVVYERSPKGLIFAYRFNHRIVGFI